MTNEFVGIIGAIGLTFLLFVLRHFILPSERGNKHRNTSKASRENHELNYGALEDARRCELPDFETGAQRRTRWYEDYRH